MSLRPPYGGFNKMVSEQAGIAIVNWSIDSLTGNIEMQRKQSSILKKQLIMAESY